MNELSQLGAQGYDLIEAESLARVLASLTAAEKAFDVGHAANKLIVALEEVSKRILQREQAA